MTQEMSFARAEMIRGAADAGMRMIDPKGELTGDFNAALASFLKTKSCRGLPADDCNATFSSAVDIARAAIAFKRANFPMTPRSVSRRFELLAALAKHLEDKFPSAEQILIFAACRRFDWEWDR